MSARTLTSTIVAAVAVATLAACGSTAATPPGTGTVAGGTPTVGTTPTAVGAAPVASNTAPSPAPTHAAPAVPTTSKGLGVANPLPGTLTYVDDSGSSTPDPDLLTWAPGSSSLVGRRFTSDAGAMYLNGAVSPNGRYVTWVNDLDKSETVGGLYIANADGSSKPRLLAKNIADIGVEPIWSPDSTHMIVASTKDNSVGVLDISTGKITRLAHQFEAVHVLWSGDGSVLGYGDGQGSIVIAAPDGSTVRTVPGIGQQVNYAVRVVDMDSLSADGSQMAVVRHTGDTPDGDAARSLFANAVVDTTTGKVVPQAVAGTMIDARFLPTGGLLMRLSGKTHNTLVLVSATGSVLQQLAEPAALRNDAIVDYTTR